MKHQGCILEFTDQRNQELMSTYRRVLAEQKFIDIASVSSRVVNSPCTRFWVSEERAMVVVSALMKGKGHILSSMRPLKREMFMEIYRRVQKLRNENPEIPLFDIVMMAVNSPAPKFYMDARCAMEYIYKIKKGRFEHTRDRFREYRNCNREEKPRRKL